MQYDGKCPGCKYRESTEENLIECNKCEKEMLKFLKDGLREELERRKRNERFIFKIG